MKTKAKDLLNIKMRDITPHQMEYFRKHMEAGAMKYRKRYFCSSCGHEVTPKHKCPNCHKYMNTAYHLCSRSGYYAYVILDKYKDMLVFRTFYVYISRKAREPEKMSFHEVYRNFWTPEGRNIVTGKKRMPMTHDKFCVFSDWTVKTNFGYNSFDYDYGGWVTYCYPRMPEFFRKRGVSADFHHLSYREFMKCLFNNKYFETLLKIGMLETFTKNGYYSFKEKWAKQVFQAHKLGYKINDASLWFDTLEMAEKLGKDIHSPKYVCPENLPKMHDKFMEKINIMEAEKMCLSYNTKYAIRVMPYAGIHLEGKGFYIEPLKQLQDVYIEAKVMHHCVWTNEYYKKKSSLLLSARTDDGARLETIEYDLNKHIVLQSRGKFNKVTDRHNDIVELMKSKKFLKQLKAI